MLLSFKFQTISSTSANKGRSIGLFSGVIKILEELHEKKKQSFISNFPSYDVHRKEPKLSEAFNNLS